MRVQVIPVNRRISYLFGRRSELEESGKRAAFESELGSCRFSAVYREELVYSRRFQDEKTMYAPVLAGESGKLTTSGGVQEFN